LTTIVSGAVNGFILEVLKQKAAPEFRGRLGD